jgi:hypothetical protein
LRIKRPGHFVGAAEFAPEDLLRNLISRLSSLAAFYGGSAERFDWEQSRNAARQVSLSESDLIWLEWTRFSSRQNTAMQQMLSRHLLERRPRHDQAPTRVQ